MKRYTKLALKIIFTVVLLAILINRADLETVGEVLFDASVTWIAAGAALGIPAMVAAGIRWGQISAYLGVPLPWRFAILGYLEGVTFNLLLPGSVAGDALRVAKITKAFGQLRRNLAAVLFDRIANLGVLLMVCLLLMFFISLGPAADHISIVLGLLAAAAAGGALALMLASRLRPLRRFRVVREVIYLSTMFRIVFLRPDRAVKVGLWSLFAQGIVVCSFAAAAYSVGISSLSVLELAISTLLALLATALPLTIGGLGLREGAVIWALTRFGVDEASAYSAALVFGAILMGQSLPGLVIWVTGGARLHIPPNEKYGPHGSPAPKNP